MGTGRYGVVYSRGLRSQVVSGLSWRVECFCDVGNCIDCGDDGIFDSVSSLLFRSSFLGVD